MDRNCDAFIRSNNTYDILIARESLEISDDRAECIQNIGEKFVAEYFDRDEVPQLSIRTYGYSIIPKCFGLLDTLALETTGILQLQNQPALSLRGQGIFIGFVDTGISYELPCFRNADGSTRIRSIWDQSIPAGEKNTPQGFLYGTEYTQKEINEALEQEHPRELVPVTDEDGHGTMLASIACGSEDLQAGFTGAAPYAELLVVKLKPAKPYLKDFFYIPQEMPAYQENDIMAAVEYLEETARKLGRPLILCLGLGTNNGSHSGGSNLSELLDDIAGRWRRCAVVATGNEANARHHFYGKSDGNSIAFLAGDDGVGDLAHQVVGLLALDVGVSHAGNLGKHLTADLDDRGIDSSKTHSNLSLFRNRKHPVLHWTAAGGICFAPGRLVPHRCNRRSDPDIQFHFNINGPA